MKPGRRIDSSTKSILITERGRPVARLESALAACPDDVEGRLGRLERAGLVRRAKIKSDANSIVAAELTKLKPESSLSPWTNDLPTRQEKRDSESSITRFNHKTGRFSGLLNATDSQP